MTASQAKARTRFLDLDEAVEERDAIEVAFAGKTYQLPGSVKADVVLAYLRLSEDGGTLPNSEVEPLFISLVGQKTLDSMLEDGLSFKKLEYLSKYLLREYGIFTGEVEDAEDGDSPN